MPLGADHAKMRVCHERRQSRGEFPRRQQPRIQVPAPDVPVVAMQRLLGVHLHEKLESFAHQIPERRKEGKNIAAPVRNDTQRIVPPAFFQPVPDIRRLLGGRRRKYLVLFRKRAREGQNLVQHIRVERMDDDRDRCLRCRGEQGRMAARRLQRIPRLLQIGVAIGRVGLEMRAFRPFVPGVDEDQPLLRVFDMRDRVPDRVFEPAAIERRRAVHEDRSAGLAPRRVVP